MNYEIECERALREDRTGQQWALLSIARSMEKLVLVVEKLASKIRTVKVSVMPKTIQVGGVANAVISGFDQFGKPFSLTSADNVSLASSVPADETFGTPMVNADGTVTVPVTGVVATSGDSITATVDSITSSADMLIITAPTPVLTTATLTLQ